MDQHKWIKFFEEHNLDLIKKQEREREINEYYREILELIEQGYLKFNLRTQEKATLMRIVKEHISGEQKINRTFNEIIREFFQKEFNIDIEKYLRNPDGLMTVVFSSRDKNFG